MHKIARQCLYYMPVYFPFNPLSIMCTGNHIHSQQLLDESVQGILQVE